MLERGPACNGGCGNLARDQGATAHVEGADAVVVGQADEAQRGVLEELLTALRRVGETERHDLGDAAGAEIGTEGGGAYEGVTQLQLANVLAQLRPAHDWHGHHLRSRAGWGTERRTVSRHRVDRVRGQRTLRRNERRRTADSRASAGASPPPK